MPDAPVVQILGIVYELSLALTSDPDPERNARRFLHVLMSKLRCGSASIWLTPVEEDAPGGLALLAAIPRRGGRPRLPPEHPLLRYTREDHPEFFREPLPEGHPLQPPLEPQAFNVVLPLDGAGVLVLGDPRGDALDPRTIAAVAPVVRRLGIVVSAQVERDRARCALERERNQLSEQVRAQVAALSDAHDLLRGVIEGAADPIAAVDHDVHLVAFNTAYRDWFARHHGAEVRHGAALLDAIEDPVQRERARNTWTRAMQGEAFTVTEMYGVDDVEPSWFEMTYSPIRAVRGGLGASLVVRDVTDRVRAEESLTRSEAILRAANRSAEEASRAKSEFLANMSHEIRTPLNAVVGMTSLLAETHLDEQQQDYVRTIREGSEYLLSILSDILDLAKIEAGRLRLEEHPFALRACIEEALRLVAGPAIEKGLELFYDLAPGTPDGIVGDQGRIQQILVNLVGNAIKFTERGEVCVYVEVTPRGGGACDVHVHVRDTGIGIPGDRLEELFQPFVQIDASTARRYGGTGLGLAISRRLVEMMRGRIWAESAAGRGSTFHVDLPSRAADVQQDVPSGPDPRLAGRRVLLVYENAHVRALLQRQLEGWGLVVDTAQTSDEALSRVRSGERFDGALLEQQASELPGDELARRLHGIDGAAQLAAIVIGGTGRACAGAEASWLPKPTFPSDLHPLLLRVIGGEAPTAGEAAEAEEPLAGRIPLRILLVEDNPMNQRVALLLLERLGYDADAVADGAEALAALERREYDLVFMDIEMPGMDGYDVTRQIRARWPARDTRIVAMTAHVGDEYRQRALDAGMDDYVEKPIHASRLQEVIEQVAEERGVRG